MKSQWTAVTLFSVVRTMFRLVRAKFKRSWRPWLGVTMSTWKAKRVTIRPDSMYAIGVLDRSHRCISHVQLVRAARHCLDNARNKWCVNFKHTKAHQGQWQNELADSLAKMGSYSFPSESALPLSMARWYQNSQTPSQTIPVTDANTMSVPFWVTGGVSTRAEPHTCKSQQ